METTINIRDLSIKCGRCDRYQTLTAWEPGDGFNRYTYECDDTGCDPEHTRTLLEVPDILDQFAKKHPESACGGSCGPPE